MYIVHVHVPAKLNLTDLKKKYINIFLTYECKPHKEQLLMC